MYVVYDNSRTCYVYNNSILSLIICFICDNCFKKFEQEFIMGRRYKTLVGRQ